MEQRILSTVKNMLGITENYDVFDAMLITHINSVFAILNQLGVGPEDGFHIEDGTAVWDEFTTKESNRYVVRAYMALKVRLLFDPPTMSYIITSITEQLRELEWRMNVDSEPSSIPDLRSLDA
jgi:hypothetical protein